MTNNTFTISRDLNVFSNDLRYKKTQYGLMKPYIDNNQLAMNWVLEPDHDQKAHFTSDRKTCGFCKNTQFVHLYFNTSKTRCEDLHEITNAEAKQHLMRLFIPPNVGDMPVAFGSLTDWKVFEMIPT